MILQLEPWNPPGLAQPRDPLSHLAPWRGQPGASWKVPGSLAPTGSGGLQPVFQALLTPSSHLARALALGSQDVSPDKLLLICQDPRGQSLLPQPPLAVCSPITYASATFSKPSPPGPTSLLPLKPQLGLFLVAVSFTEALWKGWRLASPSGLTDPWVLSSPEHPSSLASCPTHPSQETPKSSLGLRRDFRGTTGLCGSLGCPQHELPEHSPGWKSHRETPQESWHPLSSEPRPGEA